MTNVIGHRLATLHELQTIYDSEDMLLLHDIGAVTAHNSR